MNGDDGGGRCLSRDHIIIVITIMIAITVIITVMIMTTTMIIMMIIILNIHSYTTNSGANDFFIAVYVKIDTVKSYIIYMSYNNV